RSRSCPSRWSSSRSSSRRKNNLKGALRGALSLRPLSHEELEPDQPLVELAKRLAMPLVVHTDALEQRRLEVLERPEVIAVSRRNFSDQGARFGRPRVHATEPHAECGERQHHPFFAQGCASVAELAQAADL